MILKKDSLLLRIITYNGIAMILISTIMASLFGIFTVNEVNTRLLDRAREKVITLNRTYISNIEVSERQLFNAITNALNLVSLSNEEETQKKLAEVVRNQLNLESYPRYNKSYIQIISDRRKLLSESGIKEIKYDIIGSTELVPRLNVLEEKTYFFVGTGNNLYVRIIQPYRSTVNFKKYYIVLSMPLSNYNLQKIKDYVDIKKDDKIFVLSKDSYIFGELGNEKINNFFRNNKKSVKNEFFLNYNYYFYEKKIGKAPYYIAIGSLNNEYDETVGSIGIAISRKGFLAIKYMLATIILAISLISIIISTALCTRIFTKLLHPLSILADKTKGIGIDQNEIEFEEETIYEIRTIANSIKTMANRISNNENLLKNKNEKLKSNLNRIIAVENVLMGVDIDRNISESIEKILRALTSEIGFGYSRAIYFKYNEEDNTLYAKNLSINSEILSNIKKYTKGIGGFSFQIKDLENLLPLLKVKYELGNLFWESMNFGKIIFHNEKGYKFNFGNELFKSLGFFNFLILPISDKDIKLGCILVDYFEKDKIISDEEVEVMRLLLMNLLIRVKNSLLEEKKLTAERILTMSKISNKFLEENEKLIRKMESFIEKTTNREYNSKDIDKINEYLEKKKKENYIMKKMLDSSESDFRAINLEKLLIEVVEKFKVETQKTGINLSLFLNFYGNIYGDEKKLYRMFVEILKNSMTAILIRNKLDKKINILLSIAQNKKVIVEVTDNGIGMCQSELTQLIKPYSEGKRNILGLGMTMIYNIVREHKGLIRITSKLDEGTKVRIIFNEYEEENSI